MAIHGRRLNGGETKARAEFLERFCARLKRENETLYEIAANLTPKARKRFEDAGYTFGVKQQ